MIVKAHCPFPISLSELQIVHRKVKEALFAAEELVMGDVFAADKSVQFLTFELEENNDVVIRHIREGDGKKNNTDLLCLPPQKI